MNDQNAAVLGTSDRPVGEGGAPAALGGPPRFDPKLPFARPFRPSLDRVMERVRPSYDSGMITNSRLVAELEERMADRLGVAHVVAVSSCTAGLMLALQAITEGRPGDVVLPSFTFSATGHAVVWNGRAPRFVECDPQTFQIDVAHAAEQLDGASAIMATHVFGSPCDPDAVDALAASAGLPVLYDAAHAIGATCRSRPIGGFGAAEVFSLTPTKVMVAGEGGLVATDDAALAARLKIARDYGNPGNYDTQFIGLNARMSEFHAAMALESLELLDHSLGIRRRHAARYTDALGAVPGIRCQRVSADDVSTYKDFTIAVDPATFGIDRDQLVAALRHEGIDTRNYFTPPVHRQTAYATHGPVALPVTDATSNSVVSLPIYPDLSDADIDDVVGAISALHDRAEEVAAALDGRSSV